MAAVLLWARGSWRERGRALAVTALVAGLLGGAVLVVAAGARRTSSSLDRFVAETRAAELIVQVGELEPAVVERIVDLPGVVTAGQAALIFAVVEGDENNDLGLFLPLDERMGVAVESDRVLRGRRPAVDRADEVAVSEMAAEVLGLGVGDEVEIGTLTTEQVEDEAYFPPQGPLLRMTVVGVVRGIDDLAELGGGGFFASPALYPTIRGEVDEFATYAALGLDSATEPDDITAGIADLAPPGHDYGELGLDVRSEPIRDAVGATASALAAFALLAAATWVVAVTQIVGREVGAGADDRAVGGILGLTRRERVAVAAVTLAPVGLAAAAVAAVTAVALSPIMPIGLARRAEPDPGLSVDTTVLGLGMIVVVGVIVLTGLGTTAWAERRARSAHGAPTPASAAAMAAARAGAGPVVVTGVRLALDRRRPALPVRSAIVGVVLAVAGTVAVATVADSLDRTIDSPARWGIPWDLRLELTADTVQDVASAARDDDRLAAVARWDAGFTAIDGEPTRAFGLEVLRGEIGYALRSGAQPVAPDEVVVGPVTARRLAVEVGDSVELGGDEVGTPTQSARVVGIALFPQIDEGGLTDAVGLQAQTFDEVAVVPDPFEASQVIARLADGSTLDEVAVTYSEQVPGSVLAAGETTTPGAVGNLGLIRPLLGWMAGFVALLGIVSLVHVLSTTARRRRGELATLRSLGLTRRQTAGCIVAQAGVLAIVGAVVGVPLGLLAGRIAWGAVAGAAELATDPRRPLAVIVALVVATLLVAVLVALPAAIRAARVRPSVALRTS